MPTPRWLASLFRKFGSSPRPAARPGRALRVESLEDRSVPSIAASGAAAGELPIVRTFDNATLAPVSAFLAFDPAFRGGVNVAMGDVTGDGTPDIIAATAGGAPASVRVFDGASGAQVRSFFAFGGLGVGVNVASGDVDGDGRADVVVSANAVVPAVQVFSGATGTELYSFVAFDGVVGSGASVTVGDVNGDGKADIVTGIAVGGFLGVRTFDGPTGDLLSSFGAFTGYSGPLNLAAGDGDGDGKAEVLVGTATGMSAAMLFDGLSGALRGAYLPFAGFGPAFNQGLSVGFGADADGDGRPELLFGASNTPVVAAVNAGTGAVLRVGVLPLANVGNLSGPPLSTNVGTPSVPLSPPAPAPAVNGAPTVALPATFTGSGNTPLALTGVSVADPDTGSGAVRVTLGVTNGTLTLGTTGLTFTAGDGTADALTTFTGTLGAVNAALAGLTFVPNTGYVGGAVLTATVDDQGNTGAGGARTTTATSAITVNGPPTITSNGGGSSAAISISENTTAVTTVTATDADASSTLTYSITGGADAAQFTIDPATGVLAFATPPDFESPRDATGANTYRVVVAVSDGALSASQLVTVTVTDANDNAPAITSDGGGSSAAISVTEGSTAATTVTATDADASSTLIYSIVGGVDAGLFSIDSGTGVLTFNSLPDAENPADQNRDNVYDVVVRVSDGTSIDTQSIAVTVTDANDNAPTITSNGGGPSAAVNVSEGSTAVTTVTAADADAGATLIYSIVGGVDAGLFSIDSGTGVLTFNSAPDFENPGDLGGDNIYSVFVQVSDGTFSAFQNIDVTVTNANEAPTITSGDTFSVTENTTAVTTVTASDPDAGTTLTYSIAGGDDAAQFSIDPSTGVLAFNSAPDFDNPADQNGDNVYDVVVQVSDGTLIDTQSIAVTVTDVNDSAPTITSNGGGASAAINVTEGSTAVTTVTAADADAGATLTYSITGGADAAFFSVDSNTGALAFNSPPNFASPADQNGDNVYEVTVTVSDGTYADAQDISVGVQVSAT